MFELCTCKDLVAMAYYVHMLGLPLVPGAAEHVQTAQAIHYLCSLPRKQVVESRPHRRLHYCRRGVAEQNELPRSRKQVAACTAVRPSPSRLQTSVHHLGTIRFQSSP